jgi:sulfonate transport system ATP-binding protein
MGLLAALGTADAPLENLMLTVEIVEKRFGDTAVLGPMRFEVARGETVAILGPSGAGKSTLLRIVAGIDEDFEGTVVRPERMAVVFQEPVLLPWRTARDNLTIIHPDLGRDGADAALARVGIANRADAYASQLSLGQQRRLALARAFAAAPDLLIMDEPFVSLDRENAETMLDLTLGLIAETRPATLFVTHARHEAERLGARILTLSGQPATLAATD